MKLNPPETAPKDALILGGFGQHLCPVAWCEKDRKWDTVLIYRKSWSKKGLTINGIQIGTQKKTELTGWLPMPQIDDQGNVT